jgi:transcriptional regulator with XRE-family HTH domain
MSPATIANLETGKHLPTPLTVRKLANALGLDPADVYEAAYAPKAQGPLPLSAEWALEAPDDAFSRTVREADTSRLHKLLRELMGDRYSRTLEDLREEAKNPDREALALRQKTLSRALEVHHELVARGEERPERGLPALEQYLRALGIS